MSKIILIIPLTWLLFSITTLSPTASHAWLIYHKPAFKGKVIDAETKKPIEGALVVVVYNKWLFGLGPGWDGEPFDIREVFTNSDGIFQVPSYTTVRITHPFSSNRDVDFIIFKPGYGRFPGWAIPKGLNKDDQELFFSENFGEEKKLEVSSGSYHKYTMTWVNFTFGIVELPKLEDIEERKLNVKIHIPSNYKLLDKERNLIRLINEEEENLGMPKSYKGR
jgi:hypothetical protein